MLCTQFSETESPRIRHIETIIVENVEVAEKTFRLRFAAPALVPSLKPGQFVMLRLTSGDDPLLGRPLAVYRADAGSGIIDVVYLVVGKMTSRLSTLPPGTLLQVWGPLGNGFAIPECDHVVMVAGGIGQTPFHTLAEELLGLRNFGMKSDKMKSGNGELLERRVKKVSLLYGARNSQRVSCMSDFRELGVAVHVVTEDGSEGSQGLVTDFLEPVIENAGLPKVVLVCCGPHPMLKATFEKAKRLGNLPCYVSLESPMSCGLGICFSCVVQYRDDAGNMDYVRTCVDGPVFDAYRLQW
ncbi:MAG: dihydroorotate dehydrogenase electron transfer subunit [Planctomycetaceae bacterium]|nr:dihydroorotate dehydrogenase electron transfer subunit [Planctomycetaceae bacterium]